MAFWLLKIVSALPGLKGSCSNFDFCGKLSPFTVSRFAPMALSGETAYDGEV
jgi:hypothetical protein